MIYTRKFKTFIFQICNEEGIWNDWAWSHEIFSWDWIEQTEKGIFIFRNKYVKDMFARFAMSKCNLANTRIAIDTKLSNEAKGSLVYHTLYKQLVGNLM